MRIALNESHPTTWTYFSKNDEWIQDYMLKTFVPDSGQKENGNVIPRTIATNKTVN